MPNTQDIEMDSEFSIANAFLQQRCDDKTIRYAWERDDVERQNALLEDGDCEFSHMNLLRLSIPQLERYVARRSDEHAGRLTLAIRRYGITKQEAIELMPGMSESYIRRCIPLAMKLDGDLDIGMLPIERNIIQVVRFLSQHPTASLRIKRQLLIDPAAMDVIDYVMEKCDYLAFEEMYRALGHLPHDLQDTKKLAYAAYKEHNLDGYEARIVKTRIPMAMLDALSKSSVKIKRDVMYKLVSLYQEQDDISIYERLADRLIYEFLNVTEDKEVARMLARMKSSKLVEELGIERKVYTAFIKEVVNTGSVGWYRTIMGMPHVKKSRAEVDTLLPNINAEDLQRLCIDNESYISPSGLLSLTPELLAVAREHYPRMREFFYVMLLPLEFSVGETLTLLPIIYEDKPTETMWDLLPNEESRLKVVEFAAIGGSVNIADALLDSVSDIPRMFRYKNWNGNNLDNMMRITTKYGVQWIDQDGVALE